MRLYCALVFLVAMRPAMAEDFLSDPSHVTSQVQAEEIDNKGLGAANAQNARVLMQLALDLVKEFEKWVPDAYNDASVYCTIGYGHLIGKKPCQQSTVELKQFVRPLSKTDGLELLDKDTRIARHAVQILVKQPLSDEQFGALTSFVFNVGTANFQTSKLLKYLNNDEYDGALKEFPKWIKSKGKPLDGLIVRRACESDLFKGKLAYRADKKIHREDCSSLGAAPPAEELIDIEVGEK